MARSALVIAILAQSPGIAAQAAERCRFTGTTDYRGRLAIVAETGGQGGVLRVDIRLRLDAQPLPFLHTHYLMQEISVWGPDGLDRLAVNDRYSVEDHIVRQNWDVFDRTAGGLAARRIEGKRAGEFRRQHPAFAGHWDPRAFGQPWLGDFDHAAAERRPDLDLAGMSAAVRPPLALAFYWVSRLPPGGALVPVFLPGFKDRKRADLAIAAPARSDALDAPNWQAPLHYPELSLVLPSTARAWLSPDRRVRRLDLDLHGRRYSARATINAAGCTATELPAARY